MAVNPSGGITMAEIATEIGISTSSITMSNLRAQSNAYTSGTADHTGVNTTNNVLAAPDTIAEWANYIHATDFTNISYSLRTGTTKPSYGMRAKTEPPFSLPTECTAEGGMFLTRAVTGSEGNGTTKIYGDVMKWQDLLQIDNAEGTINRRYHGSGVNDHVLMGNFANNTNPRELISIPEYDVTVTLKSSSEFLSGSEGTGYPDNQITGLASGHTVISGSAKGADDANTSGNGVEVTQAWYRYDLQISKTGFNTTDLTSFVSWSYHLASSEDEGN